MNLELSTEPEKENKTKTNKYLQLSYKAGSTEDSLEQDQALDYHKEVFHEQNCGTHHNQNHSQLPIKEKPISYFRSTLLSILKTGNLLKKPYPETCHGCSIVLVQ